MKKILVLGFPNSGKSAVANGLIEEEGRFREYKNNEDHEVTNVGSNRETKCVENV